MSQRYLAPTNWFYRQNDPWPPEFPEPNTGDHYFNVVSSTLRVFYEGEWHDVGGQFEGTSAVITGTTPPSGPPSTGVGTVHVQY